MASSRNLSIALLVCLLSLLPPTIGDSFLSVEPFLGDLCKDVYCGDGNCIIRKNSPNAFECECHAGWRQPTSVHGFNFLPCIIPNCTIDVSCSNATSPASTPNISSNGSIYNPCSWNVCGGGTCKKSSSNTSFSCSCHIGYKNLMNSAFLPCIPECSAITDCDMHTSLFNFNQSNAEGESLKKSKKLKFGLIAGYAMLVGLVFVVFTCSLKVGMNVCDICEICARRKSKLLDAKKESELMGTGESGESSAQGAAGNKKVT